MKEARKGDFVALETVTRVTGQACYRGPSSYTTIHCGIVASAFKDGTVKTVRVYGKGAPLKVSMFAAQTIHVVSAERLNVKAAIEACGSHTSPLESIDTVRELVRAFLK